jgi:transposase-like protein
MNRRYGRGNRISEELRAEIVRLYCERDLQEEYLWTVDEVCRLTDSGGVTVRLVIRDTLRELLEQQARDLAISARVARPRKKKPRTR